MSEVADIKICERCLPSEGKIPTLTRYPNGRECKLCTFPFDSYSYTIRNTTYHTVCCPKCATKHMICQVCLNDFQYGIPMHLRNAMKQLVNEEADSVIPKNDMMKRFVGLSSKQVAPLNVDKLKQADAIRRWRVKEMPFYTSLNDYKGKALFLYNLDPRCDEMQIASQIIVSLDNNLERENVVVRLNAKLGIATVTFVTDPNTWAQRLISVLPKFKLGESLVKCYLPMKNRRVRIAGCHLQDLDVTKIKTEPEWDRLVHKIIVKEDQAMGLDANTSKTSKQVPNHSKKPKTLRRRHMLDL